MNSKVKLVTQDIIMCKISVYILLAWSLFTAMYSYTQK